MQYSSRFVISKNISPIQLIYVCVWDFFIWMHSIVHFSHFVFKCQNTIAFVGGGGGRLFVRGKIIRSGENYSPGGKLFARGKIIRPGENYSPGGKLFARGKIIRPGKNYSPGGKLFARGKIIRRGKTIRLGKNYSSPSQHFKTFFPDKIC